MAIKHNYNIINDIFIDTYLKINDFNVNSQIENDENGNFVKKSFICNATIIIMTLDQSKQIASINEIFEIPDINTFNLAIAYEIINAKYPGEKI